jgi:hypothetical protein
MVPVVLFNHVPQETVESRGQNTDHKTDKDLPGNLGPAQVNKDTFPLPSLGARLEKVSEIIHEGRGFVILRGLQPDKYSNLDNILLYLGVTSYIAETRGMQDFDGRMIRKFPWLWSLPCAPVTDKLHTYRPQFTSLPSLKIRRMATWPTALTLPMLHVLNRSMPICAMCSRCTR